MIKNNIQKNNIKKNQKNHNPTFKIKINYYLIKNGFKECQLFI